MAVTLIDLRLSSAYSTPWSAPSTDADGRITSSSSTPPGSMGLVYSGASDLSGDPPGGGFGINLQSRAVGNGSGTVDLSMIPSTALITRLRVRAHRNGDGHSTWLWTYVSGPAPPQGAYNTSATISARFKVTAAKAAIADNTIDSDPVSVGGAFPGDTLFGRSDVSFADAESMGDFSFASVTKAAFVAALNDVVTAVIGDSINTDAQNAMGANGGAPFSRNIRVQQTIDGFLNFAFLDYELTWTPAVPFSLTPNHGPYTGGTIVTISGSGFTGATNVLFGAQPASAFTVLSDTTIQAVAPAVPAPVVVMVSVVVGAATTAIDSFTYDPSPDYWAPPGGGGAALRGRIMIVSPNVGTNYSRGKTVTMLTGTPLANYPVTNLVDDSADLPLRISERQFELYVDLGATRTPDALALLNHNLDRTAFVQVLAGPSPGFAIPVGNFSAGYNNGWLDLRGMANRTGQFWKVRITVDNSVPVTIGELVIGSAYVMEGVLEENWKRAARYPVTREFTEEMLPYKMQSGSRQRHLELSFVLNPVNRTIIETVFDDAGVTGNRVLVIPDTGKNDPYFIDWPNRREIHFPESLRQTKVSLLLTEQSVGVI